MNAISVGCWILIGLMVPAWLYMLFVLIVEPLAYWFAEWRRRRRLVEVRTPLGRMRVGLDSPDLLTKEARRRL